MAMVILPFSFTVCRSSADAIPVKLKAMNKPTVNAVNFFMSPPFFSVGGSRRQPAGPKQPVFLYCRPCETSGDAGQGVVEQLDNFSYLV